MSKDPDINYYSPSRTEQLTDNFYLWEKRGRGWQTWNYSVELEPPFEPFFHRLPHYPAIQNIDDSRKPGLLEKFLEGFTGTSKSKEDSLYLPAPSYDLAPLAFEDRSAIKEIRVSLSPQHKITFDITEQFLLNLSYCALPISFEIIGTSKSIIIQLTCREPDYPPVKQQIQAYFPEASVSEENGFLENSWSRDKGTVVVDFGLSHEFMRPLKTFKNFEPDPLIGIIGALDNLQEGDLGILQLIFQPVRHPWPESILRSVTDREGRSFFADSPEMVRLTEEKIRRPLFAVVIRVVGQSKENERAWEITKALASGLSVTTNPQSNELIPLTNDYYEDSVHKQDVLLRQTHRSGMLLNSEELISLVHLPSVSVKAKKLLREIKKTKPSPLISTGHKLVLGENIHQGKSTVVTLSSEQRLRHTYVVGATGTGKSTLLLNLILQDIKNGLGIAVLDPHGDLIERILGFVPEERFEDVILLDPSDSDYPVGLNILSAHSEIEKNVLSSDLVSVFRRLSTSWGDQMTSVLSNAILAFLESERKGTLVDLRRFLVEMEYRRDFLKTVNDTEVVYYWQKEFPLLTGKPQASVLTRLDTFLRQKLIRYIVAQKEGLNFENILNSKKIFLAKLSQGLIGEENAYLLGTLLVSKIHQAATARQAKEIGQRENFYLYLDEFQNFITPSMTAILSGARKYGLGLILAHQELRQLWNRDTELANSVISNPYTRICFRLGDFDSQKLKDGFSYFEAQDLQNLGIGEAICRIERAEYDFNLKTIPLPEIDEAIARDRQQKLIDLSRQKYATAREKIEEELAQERRWTPEVSPSTVEEIKIESRKPVKEKPVRPVPEKKLYSDMPVIEGKGGADHRYLQALIKRMAEEKGYRAIIEKPILDGAGSVDVSLEREGKKIACEVSLTTTGEQELGNITKCIESGYDQIIICSPERKNLVKIKELAEQKLAKDHQEKVLFFQPEELFFYLEKESAASVSKEERVKGYKVKVQYQPVKETDKKTKREAVAQVILGALKRMKGK